MASEDVTNILLGCVMILAGFVGGYLRKKLDKRFGLEEGSGKQSFNRQSVVQALKNLHFMRLIVKVIVCLAVSTMVYSALKRSPWTIVFLVIILLFINYYWKVTRGREPIDTNIAFENIIVAVLTMIFVGVYIYKDLINSSGPMLIHSW